MLITWGIPALVALILFLGVGKFTGTEEYGGVNTKDDERSQLIKQKAIVGSWIFMLGVSVIGIIFDFFDITQGPLKENRLDHPSLFYLIILVGSYFVYYWIYSRRMSSNEK